MGTLNYIRPLVPNFSKQAKILYGTLKKGRFNWEEKHVETFKNLCQECLDSGRFI